MCQPIGLRFALVLVLVSMAAASTAQEAGTVQYRGKAVDPTDPREMTLALTFSPAAVAGTGDGVTGTLDTLPVCQPRTVFGGNWIGGGDAGVKASLRGPWEGRASFLLGDWSGDNLLCPPGAGAPVREAGGGPICAFMAPARSRELSVIARVFGPGPYVDYMHLPRQRLAEGVAPGNAGLPAVGPIVYDRGRAWADGRQLRMEATFQGSRVFGRIKISSQCTDTMQLPGGDLTFEAGADGPWEAPGSEILGFYGGDNIFCNGQRQADFGTLRVSLGDGPGGSPAVVFQLATEVDAGEQDYHHPPMGLSIATGAPDPFFSDAIQLCELARPVGLMLPPVTRPGGGGLPSGRFPVVVDNAGTLHTAIWDLTVSGNQVTGTAEWDSSPGVLDPLQGEITGQEVAIVRDCRPQGLETCSQVYVGAIGEESIEGVWSGTGARPSGAVVWHLDLGRN
jgi:hypothetical protein